MSNIVRAWKDAAYRESLSAEEQAMLPENPAGAFELTDAELETVYGAWGCGAWTCGGEKEGPKVINISAQGQEDPTVGCASIGFGAVCGVNDN